MSDTQSKHHIRQYGNILYLYCSACRRITTGFSNEGDNCEKLREILGSEPLVCKVCNNKISDIILDGLTGKGGSTASLPDLYPPRIQHYTSLETVRLIFSNEKIRFSRLDQVNDPLEAQSETENDVAQSHVFASCWTHQEEENITHWGRYTNDCGVRISLPINLFAGGKYFETNEVPWDIGPESTCHIALHLVTDLPSIVKIPEPIHVRYSTPMIREYELDAFFSQRYISGPTYVSYHATAEELMSPIVLGSNFDMRLLGIRKLHHWRPEKEIRFRVFATRSDVDMLSFNDYEQEDSPFFVDEKIEDKFIDVPLSSSALGNAEIIFGPKVSKRDRYNTVRFIRRRFPKVKFSKSEILIRS